MFINTDTLKNRNIVYNDQESCFYDNDSKISFDSIQAYYKGETSHYTNSFYEGKELDIELLLEDTQKMYRLAITTNKMEKYKIVDTLSEAISSYRFQKIKELYVQTGRIVFHTKFDYYDFVVGSKGVEVVFKNKKAHKGSFRVKQIYQYEGYVELRGEKKKVQVLSSLISDRIVFLALSSGMVEVIIGKPKMKIEKYLWMAFVAFGINGVVEYSFRVSLLDNIAWIKDVSMLSAIILGVVVMTAPAYWLVAKLNDKKLAQEAKELGRQASLELRMIKFIKRFTIVFIVLLVALFSYIEYILDTPPVQQSFIEDFRVVRFATTMDLFYRDDINNLIYTQLAKQYREDLKDYYKPLSFDEKKLIWQNYIKIYKLQHKIDFKVLFHKKQPIIYKFNTKSYDVKAELIVSIVPQICKTINIDFKKPPKIAIDIKDKKLYDFIQINMQKTYEFLEENRKFEK